MRSQRASCMVGELGENGWTQGLPLVPAGASHLALDSRGWGPDGEGDLCRGQNGSSLAVRVCVRVGGGVWGQARPGTFTLGGFLFILESGFGHPAWVAVACI